MTKCFVEFEKTNDLQKRETKLNCGHLQGSLAELLPCIYVAQYAVPAGGMHKKWSSESAGLFAVGARTGGDRPGVAPHFGLLLPLKLCRDESLRTALMEITALLNGITSSTMSERRRAVQDKLDLVFGGGVKIADRDSLDGFFELTPNAELIQRLRESFEYVTEIIDDPAGNVRIVKHERFRWINYGELMEWYNGLCGSDRAGQWSVLKPFIVCGNTASFRSYRTECQAQFFLNRPAEEPNKWFVLRPDLIDAKFVIRLEMDKFGWVKLHLTLDDVTATIYLSQVFDPFPELIAWSREIDEGDLPIEMEIDEEGPDAVLTVLRTDDPQRILLRVVRKYENTILLEGILSRQNMASALKVELRRFFTEEFDPQHWDFDGNPGYDEGYIPLKERVLNHPWLELQTNDKQ